MESWAGYAAVSYGQRVDGFQAYCGQASGLQPYCGQGSGLQPYCPQPSLQPTYDPVFPALLHQKASYARPDPDDWPRHHPFGVLPHEAAAAAAASTFPFPPQNPPINPHQVGGRRSPSDISPSIFQTNLPASDPLQKIADYPCRLYSNLQPNDSALKDYRCYVRQDCERLYEKPDLAKKSLENDALSQFYPSLLQSQTDLSKDYRFHPTESDENSSPKKAVEASGGDPRDYSQSSPISFALMDQRLRSPQFQQSAFRYPSVATPDEFQRSKSSESFSSNSSSDCSQRPSPLQQQPTPYVYNNNNNNQNECYKEPPAIDSPQRFPLTYSTALPRGESGRLEDSYGRQAWEDKRKFNYDVQRVQHFENNQNSCRGDPMSLVRTLHNTPEKAAETEKRNRERVVDEVIREPPPAHNHTASNQNYNFERWNLTTPASQILTQVTFSQNRLSGNDRPQSLVLPGALPYFPALHIQKQESPLQLEKDESRAPKKPIEQELQFLISDLPPSKIKFIPKVNYKSCIEEFKKFVNGEKGKSPERIIKKPGFFNNSYKFTQSNYSERFKLTKSYPPDAQDDPRYYPLPKTSQYSSPEQSDDSSDDSFTTALVQKLKGNDGRQGAITARRCACKNSSTGIKKKKIVKEERSTQTLAHAKGDGLLKSINPCSKSTSSGKESCGAAAAARLSSKQRCDASSSTTLDPAPTLGQNPLKLISYLNCLESGAGGESKVEAGGLIKKVSRKGKLNSIQLSSFKVDDFLVHKGDKDINYPPIWRVKEKNILQKFQHFVKDGVNLYIGLPSVVAWSLHKSSLYHPVPVTVAFLNKSTASSIVQVLQYPFQPTRQEKQFTENFLKEMAHLQDSFEVFIQTLFSQALDSNFLQEIYDEKDEYFVRRVGEVEAVMSDYRERLGAALNWPPSSLEDLTVWPSYQLAPASRPPRMCVCTKSPASSLLILHGNPYHPHTLLSINSPSIPINKEVAVCSVCMKLVELVHSVSHQKLGLFVCCEERVNQARDPCKDTTSLLNYLLADQPFLNQLFREVRLTWARMERCLKQNTNEAKIS